MTYNITGEPADIVRGFEQFLQELAPEKPSRNDMVMIAEHTVHVLQKDRFSIHTLTANVDIDAGIIDIQLVKV